MVTTTTSKRVVKYVKTIGHRGKPTGPQPVGMVRGKGDLIYVVSRAYEYSPGGKGVGVITLDEDYVNKFGTGGTEDGKFVWPTSIVLDKEENVYVSDEDLQRISIFSKDGEFLSKWGEAGDGDSQLNRPSGMAFDSQDNLFIVDSSNNRVQKFTKDGKYLAKWGQFGSGEGEFNLPWGIDIDKEDNVYVADWRNNRVQKFAPDGQYLMTIGTPGKWTPRRPNHQELYLAPDGELSRPADVAVDKDGDIWVTDNRNDRVEVFAPDGSFLLTLTGEATLTNMGIAILDANPEMWEERAISDNFWMERLFWSPLAIAVDDDNRVFVSETCRGRIQIYQKES